ncbi:helicase-associated domain-containing protein [Arthrobacter sp. zg-Y40]|uniref:helicase-associated domain-containing protein n=1 Tax=unclassified Arthrobacter TaxID=235627 RepID=UPI001D13C9E5|nr:MULTISPECIES: helicase-associated domain-containing protein [unclassified Arthrobacter]MCC3276674.1 helicase-associated domain-containing protein [Arthrobacter sp. zg-Y20]MCC3279783.1 helicase-associated domain-containing protein [Arthrobacter sp. zg-Y40]MDK1316833.1 helicase-associated domain-containing protein [Arthrobacter sp. zg.Y20]MDK1328151.1 helicase-associated domain-containing protein [Arthrobacter sp. zg-Y1143]WIB06753.1 helicase-associated domain-containing protein [Arthrobacter
MSAIRALADDLAARSDDQLRELFAARPDLVLPPVPDFQALAARASTRVSVQRILEKLTAPELQVLEAVDLTTNEDSQLSTTASWLKAAIAGSTIKSLDAILAHLHSLALLRRAKPHPGAPKADASRRFYLPVSVLGEALGAYPAGLGRPYSTLAAQHPEFGQRLVGIVEGLRSTGLPLEKADTPATAAHSLHHLVSDPAGWAALMNGAPPGTTELLRRFKYSPVGTIPKKATMGRAVLDNPSPTPVEWLVSRGLLVPLDALHVELPRPVGQASRGHVIVSDFQLEAPRPSPRSVTRNLRDNAAFGAVAETLRLVTELLALAAENPVGTLRSGGVGVREVRRLSESLRLDGATTSWLLELAAIAGLITLDAATSRWGASEGNWLNENREEQWRRLVEAWLDADRAPSLVGAPLPAGGAVNALAAEVSRPDAPVVRRRAMEMLALLSERDSENGTVGAFDPEDLISALTWHQPRLQRRFARLVPGILKEAAQLGLLGSGALTLLGSSVAAGDYAAATQVLRDALPAPLNSFLLQADLTAVAPGYLEPDVARELALISTAEGQGPAAIYRFSADSIRRALDEGHDADGILAFLRQHSATEVPQPLRYLVEDTAARYGRLRVGAAGSYLRSDDEAGLNALLADPRTASLGLVRLAPTVVAANVPAKELTSSLRDLGYPPALEGPARKPVGSHRMVPVAAPSSSKTRLNPWELTDADLERQLAALRGEGPPLQANGESQSLVSLETLRKAIRTKSSVRMGVVDSQGNQRQEIFVPLSVTEGRVRVYDPRHDVERTVSVHRIMDVEIVEGSPAHG